MDNLSPAERSQLMSKIKSKNTQPEIRVRKLLHGLGLRFRLHQRKLPGCPDIVLAKHKTVVFVHGCFWHGHAKKGCPGARIPKSNVEFWQKKIQTNGERDKRDQKLLRKDGWRVLVIWQCELNDLDRVEKKLVKSFTSNDRSI